LALFFSFSEFDVDHDGSLFDGVGHVNVEPIGEFSGSDHFVVFSQRVIFWVESVVIRGEVEFLDARFRGDESD
jgi:hypothetical protein